MKRAVLLHGTDGQPSDQWFPWLKSQLEHDGFHVFAPILPENHTPDKDVYASFLKSSGWDFRNNIMVGHSSGATTVLNLLSEDWFPAIHTAILVGTFLNEKWTKNAAWYEPGQFKNLFKERYDYESIKQKSKHFYFVHGDDDPFCDIDDAKTVSEKLNGTFLTIKQGHHLGGSSGVTELPQLFSRLKSDKIFDEDN